MSNWRKDKEEDDYYDCQESLEEEEKEEEKEEEEMKMKMKMKKESGQDTTESEDFYIKTNRLSDNRDTERETGGGGGGDEGGGQEEEEEEVKEEVDQGVEFDDDYLREVEKELTEEEKESRRQQSFTLKETGNSHFKAGDWTEAERSYTEALVLCPVGFSRDRAVLFSNRAAARLHLDLKDQAISDCSRAIELDANYLRAWLRRAELYEQTEKLDEALEDYKKVLEQDPNHSGARQASMRLPQQIQERNEKLKEEMISKLKDLGNMILRPFGLSTSNFQVNQDRDSGSYSVNFVQNPGNNNR
ncbi:tetratricopeptide repeat protein 1 [Mugil cephalus]|uniref:tetratricopeptide repeat protein 1 n=1 Tax=Mugil cephalus TaxID=48193 RepID=UPI001FB7883A|nr:tetratricopeptide repeat protein 1 [Mugil cephalus]